MSANDVVAFIHIVETTLGLFGSDRGGEAGRRGRWWRVETPERLEQVRLREWLCTDTACRDRQIDLTFRSVSFRNRDAPERRLQGMAHQGRKITIVQGFVRVTRLLLVCFCDVRE